MPVTVNYSQSLDEPFCSFESTCCSTSLPTQTPSYPLSQVTSSKEIWHVHPVHFQSVTFFCMGSINTFHTVSYNQVLNIVSLWLDCQIFKGRLFYSDVFFQGTEHCLPCTITLISTHICPYLCNLVKQVSWCGSLLSPNPAYHSSLLCLNDSSLSRGIHFIPSGFS